RAREEGVSIRELTERTYRQFKEDISALGVLDPTYEPRATENIPEMIDIIERLIRRGHAYVAESHVLFDVASTRDYGWLAHRSLDEMIAGARVDIAPYKRDPMDFVLWKPSDAETPGWDSPWGRGRPGWHIECSAMSWKLLGEEFDIHGGGIDLVFPHHENELAQTTCAFGHDIMAKVWMHNGHLQVESQKMSKSLGNFVTIHELLQDWPGEVLRFNMLRTHYRQPMDWTVAGLEESWKTLGGWFGELEPSGSPAVMSGPVFEALLDDLNTPLAIAELHKNESRSRSALLKALGFDGRIASRKLDRIDADRVDGLVAARLAARKQKKWAESDRIRDELAAMGVVLHDNKDGTTTWEVKR
ncbi:MAG: cysteine--tRNA ligase, partial [Hyphomicrobiales bacterium]